jgi:parallel beta-helix repeat protein
VEIYNISVNGYVATTVGGGCAPGNAGIYFRNASGSIVDSAVAYIGLNPDGSVTGCQEGIAVYIESYGGTANVTMTGTSIHDYDKNGVTADGTSATLVAKNNAVTGVGPTTATAQNGIQVSDGAKGTIDNNVVTGDDYRGEYYGGSGILMYSAAANTEANDNVVSDTNLGIYFYLSNDGTANGNNVSKSVTFDALVAQNSNHVVFEKNVIAQAGLGDDQPAVYLCGSDNKVEDNTISEAPIGVQDDRTSADDCSGAGGNTTKDNVYTNVGTDTQILTNEATAATRSLNSRVSGTRPKVSPSK